MDILLYISIALEAVIIIMLIVILSRRSGGDSSIINMSGQIQDRLTTAMEGFRQSQEERFRTMESRLSDLSLSLRGGMDAIAATEKTYAEYLPSDMKKTIREKLQFDLPAIETE